MSDAGGTLACRPRPHIIPVNPTQAIDKAGGATGSGSFGAGHIVPPVPATQSHSRTRASSPRKSLPPSSLPMLGLVLKWDHGGPQRFAPDSAEK